MSLLQKPNIKNDATILKAYNDVHGDGMRIIFTGFLPQSYQKFFFFPLVLQVHRISLLITCTFLMKEIYHFSTCQSCYKNYFKLLE